MTLDEVKALAECHGISIRITEAGVGFGSERDFMILVNAIEQLAGGSQEPEAAGKLDDAE